MSSTQPEIVVGIDFGMTFTGEYSEITSIIVVSNCMPSQVLHMPTGICSSRRSFKNGPENFTNPHGRYLRSFAIQTLESIPNGAFPANSMMIRKSGSSGG